MLQGECEGGICRQMSSYPGDLFEDADESRRGDDAPG